ncbi:MAG: restriction endonuclease [Balneolaceae bacterium]
MNIYCVRADFGTYYDHFIKGNYIAIGWISETDLSSVKSKEELYPIYREAHPEDESNIVIGQQVGQISRFLFDIKPGDYVLTMPSNTDYIHYGIVEDGNYYYDKNSDSCPYPHRRPIKWHKEQIQRNLFSVPFQNSIRSSLTVFNVRHKKNFFTVINKPSLIPESEKRVSYDYYNTVLNRILELDPTEFEILITHILTALGFEGSEHTGKVGDGGVDAIGELNISNLAKIKLFIQAKRYKKGKRIRANEVKALRANIPKDGQGAFITTADYQNKAKEIAVDPNFPRIGLINGQQLVDILTENWNDLPKEFQDKLGLKVGLVIEN